MDGQRFFGRRPCGDTTISFFSAPAPRVAETIIEWGREVRRRVTPHFPIVGTWYEFLGEYVTPSNAIVVAPTRGAWCAYINNDRLGGMPLSELVVIPERLGISSVSFVVGDLFQCKEEKRPYAAMFQFVDATGGEAVVRSVSVIYDGGRWEYDECGAPLPFEELDAYKGRNKRARLTSDMLIRYGRALGIHLDDGDAFYELDGAIGLTWEWVRSGDIVEDIAPLKQMAEQINEELGANWKLKYFGK